MKFSIVTPTRNSLVQLRKCVGSVRGQRGAQCEHIIQDACSGDGTQAWLSGQRDIRTFVESDSGMYDAINRGWSKASGDIFCWLNSDEQYLPGTLKIVAEIFTRHPKVDFVRGNTIIVDAEGTPIAARRDVRLTQLYTVNGFLDPYTCSLFFRRQLWEEGTIRLDDRYRYAGDMEMILRLLRSGKRGLHTKQYLALFTFDGSNLSCHPAMLEETAEIQCRYGALRATPARKAVVACRYIERFLEGAYRKVALTYDYALDDMPTYRRVSGYSVPGSYKTR